MWSSANIKGTPDPTENEMRNTVRALLHRRGHQESATLACKPGPRYPVPRYALVLATWWR